MEKITVKTTIPEFMHQAEGQCRQEYCDALINWQENLRQKGERSNTYISTQILGMIEQCKSYGNCILQMPEVSMPTVKREGQ